MPDRQKEYNRLCKIYIKEGARVKPGGNVGKGEGEKEEKRRNAMTDSNRSGGAILQVMSLCLSGLKGPLRVDVGGRVSSRAVA